MAIPEAVPSSVLVNGAGTEPLQIVCELAIVPPDTVLIVILTKIIKKLTSFSIKC